MQGPGHAGKRRGLLRRRERPTMFAMREAVQLLEEGNSIEVFASSVRVRHPLARLARVIEVEHRGDGVHAQAVDVVLLEPEQRVRQQKVPALVAALVEDEGT